MPGINCPIIRTIQSTWRAHYR